MNKIIVLISILSVLFCSEPKKGTDYPTFKGNFYRTGFSPDKGPSDDPKLIWWIDLQSQTTSSPIVVDGRMYLGHYGGMTCANVYSGKIYWQFHTEKKVFCTPTYYQGDIIFGGWDYYLYRLRADNGEKIWGKRFRSAIETSPVITNENIYIGDFSGMFLEVIRESGNIARLYPAGNWIVGSAAFDGKTFYYGSRDSVFYALDRESFDTIWEFNAGGDINCTPAIDDEAVYFGSFNMKLYGLKRSNGEMNWEFNTNGVMFSSPALYNDKVFCGSTDSTVYCVDRIAGEEIWRFRTDGLIYSSATVCGNRVYIGSYDGYLYAIDTETGELVWKRSLKSSITSSPVVYDDILIAACDNGAVFAFR